MVEVVEFSDAREARLQHFHVGKCRDCLDVVRIQHFQETVHDLAPGPERIVGWAAMFGNPGHPALERVAMEVGKARNCDAGDMVGPDRKSTRLNSSHLGISYAV